MKQNQQQIQNNHQTPSTLIGFKIPFPCQNISSAYNYITHDNLQQICNDQENITLGNINTVTISKKKITRSLYQVKVGEYRNKKTNQIVYKIEDNNQIMKIYEINKMADFYLTTDQSSSLNDMKSLLKQKILQGKSLNEYQFALKPHSFLKSFNLSLPTSDLLINKSKSGLSKKQQKSRHIAFGQEIPQPITDIPQHVITLKIFPIIQQYFNKRPCWLRNVIEYQLRNDGLKGEYSQNQLKNVLKFLSFTYHDGPWKHVFCRFGFNPTKSNQAALYQILIVKIKRKEVEDYDLQVDHEQSGVYDPTLKEIPTKFERTYQMCDIEDKRIQQMVRGGTLSSSQCNKQFGWFNKNQFLEIQRITKSIRQGINKI